MGGEVAGMREAVRNGCDVEKREEVKDEGTLLTVDMT